MSDHSNAVRSAAAFESHRGYLTGLAYRMVGSVGEAEDLVQEAYLRWHDSAPESIASPRGWLTTVVTRLAIDHLRSARSRRESYVGPWLPEPLITDGATPASVTRQSVTSQASSPLARDPESNAQLAESLSTALLLVLETLAPVERAAYLLRVVFDTSYSELATILGRNEAACRQLVSRAQRRVVAQRPRVRLDEDEQTRLLERLTVAIAGGEADDVRQLLAEDAVLISDGGGQVQALKKPLQGARPIARFLVGIASRQESGTRAEVIGINGNVGLVVRRDGVPQVAMTFDAADDRITSLYLVRNPSKLARLVAGPSRSHN